MLCLIIWGNNTNKNTKFKSPAGSGRITNTDTCYLPLLKNIGFPWKEMNAFFLYYELKILNM